MEVNMKSFRLFLFLAASLTLTAGWVLVQAAQAPATTVTGTLVDGTCYMMNPANTGDKHGPMEGCGKMCLSKGAPAAVLSADKTLHPIMAFSASFADIVGQTVRVSGPVQGTAILAKKVEVNKGGRWEEVKLLSMK
jgi:hypothetical protein